MGIEGTGQGAGESGTGNQPAATAQPTTPPPSSGATPTTPPQAATATTPEIPEGNIDALPPWAKTLVQNLRQSERKLKQIEDRDKTEATKLQERVTELEGQLGQKDGTIRDFRVGGVFETEAAKAGAIDPKLLYQVAKDQINTDKDGNATNLAEVLKNLKASHPSQFRQVRQTPNVDAGAAGGNATQGGGGNATGVSVTDWMRNSVGRHGG
jgi:hypothetical protein